MVFRVLSGNHMSIGIGLGFGNVFYRKVLNLTTFRTTLRTTFWQISDISEILPKQWFLAKSPIKQGKPQYKRNPLLVNMDTSKTTTFDTTRTDTWRPLGPTLDDHSDRHWAYTGPTLGPTWPKCMSDLAEMHVRLGRNVWNVWNVWKCRNSWKVPKFVKSAEIRENAEIALETP